MGKPVAATTILQQRWGESWLGGAGTERFWSQLEQFQAHFQARFHPATPPDILLAEAEPVRFLAAFLAACQVPGRVWLANPHWGLGEWQQVAAQCEPELVIGSVPEGLWDSAANFAQCRNIARPQGGMSQILIPTGGSSGDIRFAVHTWETLTAAVQGFQQHFHCDRVNAYCVLPLYHVSGLMQALRCLLFDGKLVIQPFRALLQDGAIATPAAHRFLSLVPTQLQRLLNAERDFGPWLRSFTAILLGGAPASATLLQTARELQLPLAPTYGMTETAAQVATLLPHEFLAGLSNSGRALPHVHITIRDDGGNPLPPGETGRIALAATSLARGYGEMAFTHPFHSGDLGYLDEAGYLHVVGRANTLILTGGEKVLPAEVESAILRTGLVQDAVVLGISDETWGEQVVAVIVPKREGWNRDHLIAALKPQLSAYKLPKQWLSRPALPYSLQGKLNRAELRQWVLQTVASTGPTTPSAPG
ncbi:MAG: AMP-binding protein [Leptolyngbyaceae cyanobacterium]